MRRLLEGSPADASEQRLTELVRGARPVEPDAQSKRQTYMRIMRARDGASRRPRWFQRLLWSGALFSGGTALAALSDAWLSAEPDASTPAREAGQGSSPLELGSPRPSDDAQANADQPISEEGEAEADGARATSDLEELGVARQGPARQGPARQAPARQAPAAPTQGADTTGPRRGVQDGEDPALVMAAIRAWRSEHDAQKARLLLNAYLRETPRGALAEDALALLIEVAAAQKDPQATSHAARYLRIYPKGRFRSMAQKVVDASR